MFGRKKKKKKNEIEESVEQETPDLEISPEELEEEDLREKTEKMKAEIKRLKEKKAEKAEIKEIKEIPKSEKIEYKATIMNGEILESGLFRYSVISNKSLGEIGESFPLDD